MKLSTIHSQLLTARRKWLSLWLQERRRQRQSAGVVVAAPVINSAWSEYGATESLWWDAILEFAFQHGSLPVAVLELWLRVDGNEPYGLVTTIPSTAITYRHVKVAQGEHSLAYKLRYVGGAVVGPFSTEVEISLEL